MRLVAAILVAAVSIALAVWLHSYDHFELQTEQHSDGGLYVFYGPRHPDWADPVALVVAIAGLACALVIAFPLLRRFGESGRSHPDSTSPHDWRM